MKAKIKFETPRVTQNVELEQESPILAGAGSNIDFRVTVDPLEEYYYDGTEETADYLIDF